MTTSVKQSMDLWLTILEQGPLSLRGHLYVLALGVLDQAAAERDMRSRRLLAEAQVSGEKDDVGKPRYSNEMARKAAAEEVLAWDPATVSLQREIDDRTREIALTEVEVEYQRALLGAARAAAYILRPEA